MMLYVGVPQKPNIPNLGAIGGFAMIVNFKAPELVEVRAK